MAFISTAFTAGQTLTAASMEDLRGNANAGHSVFTNEAARDAAITAPTEGLMAYLTAATVPAATGATTAVPTGVTTIYNGSVWVCTTPVGAYSNTAGTSTSTSYVTTLTGDSTVIAVTLVTGTTALLNFNATAYNNNVAQTVLLSFAVSGATTIAASDANGCTFSEATAGYQYQLARSYAFTGLTAGTNTFTLSYKCSGGTMGFSNRNLTVQGIA